MGRLSQSKNKPVPVNVPDSRPSSLLVMKMVMLALVSSAPRKSPPPSVVPSFLPSSLLSQSDVVTGVTSLVLHTLSQERFTVNVVPSTSVSSQPHVVLVSSAVQFQRSLCKWLVLKMFTLVLVVVPPPSVTLPRLLSKLSVVPTISRLQNSGRTITWVLHHLKNTLTTWKRITKLVVYNVAKSRTIELVHKNLFPV